MKKLIGVLVLCFLAFFQVSDAAEVGGSSGLKKGDLFGDRAGFYTQFLAGSNLYIPILRGTKYTGSEAGFVGLGWGVALGYELNDASSMELGFMQSYAKLRDKKEVSTPVIIHSPYIAAKFIVSDFIQPKWFIKLGVMHPQFTAKYAKTKVQSPGSILPFSGFGAIYKVDERVDLSVQYQGAIYGGTNIGLLSVGVAYHYI